MTILRGARVIVPEGDEPLEGGDELLFVAVTEVEDELQELLLRPKPRAPQVTPHARCVCAKPGGGVARSWHARRRLR